MDKQDKFNMVLPEGTTEIIYREGKAPDVPVPHKVKLSGAITAPADWVEGKRSNELPIDMAHAYVTVDEHKGIITLVTEETFDLGHEIIGKLEMNPDLLTFNINPRSSGAAMTASAMSSFLKMNRTFFVDSDENLNVVTNLQKFKAQVIKEVESNNDLRGNKLEFRAQAIHTEFDLKFTLSMPIYKGSQSRKFLVEILFDIGDTGSIVYWLESVELRELEMQEKEYLLDAQLSRINQFTTIKV